MTDRKIVISVIVAAYDIVDYLPRCMESLLRQTYDELEIILVDDGSTDGTEKLCDAYAEKYVNVKVIHRENGGLSAARNSGLEIAKGTFIGYVDGDDWVEPDMYKKMLQACLDYQAQIAICSYRQIGEGAEEIHPDGKTILLSGEEALNWYINGHPQYHIYNSVWSKLFDRSLVEDLRFPKGRKSEDIMYTTRALTRAKQCVFLDEPYYNYVMNRKGSIMNSGLAKRRFEDEIPFWREQIAYLKEQEKELLSEQAAYQFYRRMLFYYIDFQKKKMKEAAAMLIRMLRSEKKEISRIYQKEFVAAGDLVRMKTALCMPHIYYLMVQVYDKFIIPLRQ